MSVYRIASNKLRTVKITEVRRETPRVKSFTFRDELCAKGRAGQFVMVWVPGVDEVPMSLSAFDPVGGSACMTVERVGEATRALHRMKAGAILGVRGPFGNGFTTSRVRTAMVVGGGTGLACLAPLAEELAEDGVRLGVLLGAKTSGDLLFLDRFRSAASQTKGRIVVTTEDGSSGLLGLVTAEAERLLDQGEKFDVIYTCGPEKMMCKMFQLCERFGVPLQASLERFMRCAIGLCGTCVVGRYRVCRDGPVFTNAQLREVEDEFGRLRRGFDGRQISV